MTTVTQAMISRAITAMEKAGRPVKGAYISPDGSVTLLTDPPHDALPAPKTGGSWVDLAGETEIPRA